MLIIIDYCSKENNQFLHSLVFSETWLFVMNIVKVYGKWYTIP